MSTAEQDVNDFASFALQEIESGKRNLSIDELFDQWRTGNPSDEQYAENVAAAQASMQDYRSGERGTIAGDASAHLRRRN